MTKKVVVFSALLFSCCFAVAQTPAAEPSKPAVTTAESPDLKEIQKIEDAWSKAVNIRDQYALELVLSPLFVDVASNGDISTRNQQLAQVVNGEDKTVHMEQRVITVRMLGDIAVANGTYILHHRGSSAVVDEKGVFTHVYERLHGNWICINSQRTSLREDAAGKAKKQSASDSFFHLPLFNRPEKKDQ